MIHLREHRNMGIRAQGQEVIDHPDEVARRILRNFAT